MIIATPVKVCVRVFGKFHFFKATPSTLNDRHTIVCEHYHTKEKKTTEVLA
jgi:hypothetical protein